MIKPLTEKELVQQSVELAAHTRRKIEAAGLLITDFEQVASLFDVTVTWGELPDGKEGSYLKDKRKIVLSTHITTPERINFSFCHEIMHARIEDDADILNDFADAYRRSDEEAMERLCNAGAAELLMPADEMREYGCSVGLIPELCERFAASSIAVAFQLVNCATHECYLIIAEPTWITNDEVLPMLPLAAFGGSKERLIIVYSGRSPVLKKYSIKKPQILSIDHALYEALRHPDTALKMDAKLPFASGKGWGVPCDMLYFRGKVFAVFHQSPPPNPDQLALF